LFPHLTSVKTLIIILVIISKCQWSNPIYIKFLFISVGEIIETNWKGKWAFLWNATVMHNSWNNIRQWEQLERAWH